MRLLAALPIAVSILIALPVDAASPPSDEVFRSLILQRVEAHSRGDAAAYRRLLAEGFVHVDDTGKRRTVAEMESAHGSGNHSSWELGVSHARLVAPSLAIIDCEITELVPFGPRQIRMPLHETDVFVLRKGRWLFLEHAETHAIDSPIAVTLYAATLDDYVGRYEFWPGFEDTVTRTGSQLYVQSTGDASPSPLRAASDDSFFVEGDPAIGVFVRGRDGRVNGELAHFPDGKVLVARKRDERQ